MKTNTKNLLAMMILLVFLFIVILSYFYQKEQKLVFYATVKEAYSNSAIIVPFPDEKITQTAKELSANIAGLKVGQVIKVTAESVVKETYPAMINVISFEYIFKPTTSTTTTTFYRVVS